MFKKKFTVTAAALAVAAFALTGCSALTGGGSPEKVAEQYLDAMADGDMEKVLELTVGGRDSLPTKDIDGDIDLPSGDPIDAGLTERITDIKIGESTGADTQAVVSSSFSLAGERHDLSLELQEIDGEFLVSDPPPILWFAEFDDNHPLTTEWQYLLAGDHRVEAPGVWAPYGEYRLKPATDNWSVEDLDDAEYRVLLLPDVKDVRANGSGPEYDVRLTGDLTVIQDVESFIPAIREACDAYAEAETLERGDSPAEGRSWQPAPNKVFCPTGDPVEIVAEASTSPEGDHGLQIFVSFSEENSWTDNQGAHAGETPMRVIEAHIIEGGTVSDVSLRGWLPGEDPGF